ncbi:sulfur carrier protein ThiS [Halalkalibaculum sp. DA3122]|uniref:sulfur carrier protein ThiS n=1 Tax=unclassified Halalkalibaculum TaxID=2964617 RepID=UPI003754B9D6
MKLTVNGDTVNTQANTVKKLLAEFDVEDDGDSKGTAVALNDSVVPKSQWDRQQLHEEDRIEIIRATQGG